MQDKPGKSAPPCEEREPTLEEIEQLRQQIEEATSTGDSAIAFSAQRVRVCADIGSVLNTWQKRLGKGVWGRFVAEHYPDLNERTRQRWMRLATLRDAGRLDVDSCRGLRQAYQLALLLPEADESNTKPSSSAAGWLVHLSRLMRALELLDLGRLTPHQRCEVAERLQPVTGFATKAREYA